MPIYPQLAKQAHIEGTVVLHAIIAKDGTISNLQFISGHPLLMKAAIDAVRQWQYKPTLLNGESVEVDTTITVVFTLGETPPLDLSRPETHSGDSTKDQTDAALNQGVEGVETLCPGDGLVRVFVSPKAEAARLKVRVEPIYPEDAKKAGMEGTVLFHAIIGVDGTVKELELEDGEPALAKAAEDAVRQWKYDGMTYYESTEGRSRPAEVDTAIAVQFKLPH